MLLYCCDKCGSKISSEFTVKKVTPGYVGHKDLCEACYKTWVGVVLGFFNAE